MNDTISELRRRAKDVSSEVGAPLGVAVSGGSDSLATLHLLAETGVSLAVVTVDHGLRVESAEEAHFVAEECRKLNVPHAVLRWEGPEESGNLQDQARVARYNLIADWARASELGAVVLGHTSDDEAETFIMRLARGSGIDGLTRLNKRFERDGMTFLRPFTDFRRETLRHFLRDKNLLWIEDPTNDDERFDRVKARRILNALEPLGVTVDRLGMTMGNLATARTALQFAAREIAEMHVRFDRGDLVFEWDMLKLNPWETQRRLLIGAVMHLSGNDYPPRRETVNELRKALVDRRNMTIGGCYVSHEAGDTRITREFNAVKDVSVPTKDAWDGRWQLAGPHAPELEVRALGNAVKETPWRHTGMPRQSLLASPAVWKGETLIAAPVAGLRNGWTANATGRGKFADFLISR